MAKRLVLHKPNAFLSCGVRKACSCHNYSSKLEELFNNQIQAEQQAAQDYLNLAVRFQHRSVSRIGTGKFFMNMFDEELTHMRSLISYQLIRGGSVCIGNLKKPTPLANHNMLQAFQIALSMETAITELLENIVNTAELLKDYHCVDFITSSFLTEQLKSIDEISHHVAKLSRISDNEHALLYYDFHLGNSCPDIKQ